MRESMLGPEAVVDCVFNPNKVYWGCAAHYYRSVTYDGLHPERNTAIAAILLQGREVQSVD